MLEGSFSVHADVFKGKNLNNYGGSKSGVLHPM